MKAIIRLTVIGILTSNVSAQAQDCRSIADSRARLACYDKSTATPSFSASPVSRQAPIANAPASNDTPSVNPSPSSFASINGNIREFAGEDPIRVIAAAQAVMLRSDPSGFTVQRYLDGFEGSRDYRYRKVVGGGFGRDSWYFQSEVAGGSVRGSVNVTQTSTIADNFGANSTESAQINPALATLFWARVDYMLGKRADWPMCPSSMAENDPLNGLCGDTNTGRLAPPPRQFAPLQASNVPSAGAAKRGAAQ